jgi:hypothetical protein
MKYEDMVAKQTKILEASSIEIKKISEEIHEKLIKVRRRFHKHPELGALYPKLSLWTAISN